MAHNKHIGSANEDATTYGMPRYIKVLTNSNTKKIKSCAIKYQMSFMLTQVLILVA